MTAVDVVIPVRDGGPLLQRAVDSVLTQEGVRVRVLVVDDGSRDGAPQALRRDPRLLVLPCRGRGIPDALETGISAGDAPYVARQDADDESLPGRLARQVHHLEHHPGIGMVATHAELVVGERLLTTLTPSLSGFADANPVVAGSVVLRRQVLDAVGGHRRVFALAEDYDLWLRVAASHGVALLPFVGYRYRLSAAQSSVRRPSAIAAYAALAQASASAVREGRPDPAAGAVQVQVQDDTEADAQVLLWWAREFRALGAEADAEACCRVLPDHLRAQLVDDAEPQAVWA